MYIIWKVMYIQVPANMQKIAYCYNAMLYAYNFLIVFEWLWQAALKYLNFFCTQVMHIVHVLLPSPRDIWLITQLEKVKLHVSDKNYTELSYALFIPDCFINERFTYKRCETEHSSHRRMKYLFIQRPTSELPICENLRYSFCKYEYK